LPWLQLAFNLAVFAVETTMAVLLFRAFVGPGAVDATLTTWFALIVAMSVGVVLAGSLIAVVISFYEGDVFGRLRTELRHGYLFYVPSAILGASCAIPTLVAGWLIVPFLVPAPVVWMVLRSHGALLHRFGDLNDIHEFSSHVGRSAQLGEIVDTGVHEISRHIRATKVALVVWSEEGNPLRVSNGCQDLLDVMPIDASDVNWHRVTAGTQPVTIVASEDGDVLGGVLLGIGVREALAVPMIDGEGCIGVLAVADRHGVVDSFDKDDMRRLLALSQQLVVALRKGQLHVQIQHQALHDRLTGLPNRAYFEAATGRILGSSPSTRHSLLLIDLDQFKEVNDTFGHHAGDQLLIEVSKRISAELSGPSLGFRFGGDEFAIVAPGVDEVGAVELAERVSDALERTFEMGDVSIALAASIGIAVSPGHGRRVDDLVRRADLAMYDAKDRHERYEVFTDRLEVTDSARLEMLGDLRQCLFDGRLEVHFQPKVEMATNEVYAVEALARWTHAERGPIPPDVFIPLAEQSGLIGALTQYVLDRSLEATKHWLDQGYRIGVAVNVSAQTLVREDLPQLIASSLEAAGVEADLLTVEITESTMMGDDERTFSTLEQLDALGIKLSVDDFGTGYSSLTNLKHLPVSELKIDRSFVLGLGTGPSDEVIVRSTIELGHNLGLTVVAEGVETDEQFDILREFGCDLGQGYGICRPIPLDELDQWIAMRSASNLSRQRIR
jgi:diguanylate cyclase (GGDEF)-like protein